VNGRCTASGGFGADGGADAHAGAIMNIIRIAAHTPDLQGKWGDLPL